jgi:hypothetical protein
MSKATDVPSSDPSSSDDGQTEREKELKDKLGSRTILLVLISLAAMIEALVIIRLAS